MQSRRAPLGWILTTLALAAGVVIASFPTDPPNDPNYSADTCPPASTCAGPTGQWNLFSFDAHFPPTLRPSGISADLAWQVTTGRPDVAVAILDSGVDYDHEDLRFKIWLNRGELPVPLGTCTPPPGDPHDCNADGSFDMRDYATDPRITDVNGDGAIDRGDLRTNPVFTNGIDDDANGYVDDLSGWDADDDDGDEFDHRYFGHGTGRAGILAPETNNGVGVAGICPLCPLMNVRIDDTFVASSDGVAKGAIWAVDNGATVLSMSLGAQTASRLSRGAFDYATTHDVLAVNASANEFSFHQNFQAVFDDVMTIGGVGPNSRMLTTTWLQKANFANYGAHLDVIAPTVTPGADMGHAGALPDHASYTETASGTSTSTPHAAGVAALVFSRGKDIALAPSLSAQEVRQIINATADDVTPTDATSYPVATGWDRWTGYGRVNASAAVNRVAPGTIPPEADINAPDWYTLVDGTVNVQFYANARRAATFSWTLQVGSGVEPLSFSTVGTASGVAANPALSSANRVSNLSASWNTTALANGLYTLRLTVTDNLGNSGEDRMAVWVRHPDPQDLPGFPRVFDGSLESLSVALVDLDGDNALEVIFADGNGEVHAVQSDGSDLPGFPVHTGLPKNLPLATSPAFDGNAANGEVAVSYASIIGGVAVGDLDRDGRQDILVGAEDGQLYCWHGDASVCAGFPVSTDHGFSRDPYGTHAQVMNPSRGEHILATPALGDLDGDDTLEIVAGSIDQKLYVWHADGSRMAPFPIALFDPGSASGIDEFAPKAVLTSAAIADVDADGQNEMVVGTTEVYGTPNVGGIGGSGRAYLVEANGTIHAGWPVKPTSISPSNVPLVAEGVGASPILADLDGNGTKEIALAAFLGDPTIYRADGTTFATMQGAPFGTTGAGSLDFDEATVEGGAANASDQPSHFYVAQQAFADLDGDTLLDYFTGSIGDRIALFAAAAVAGDQAGPRVIFDHLLSAWTAATGVQKPNFPRVIEDWQFVTGPAVAEISGDPLPEVLATSGGYFVHAFNALGLEPSGWPKLTGQWQTSTPSIGDLDGDGTVEVVQTTRLGTLFVWKTAGATCQADQWRKFRHDEWNTGTYGADTRRPARIDDLDTSADVANLTLDWTAVGDDARCGTATTYELRAASVPITEATFDSATPIAIPAPAAAGTAESRTIIPPAGTRFLALRAVDEAGNAGPLAVEDVSELFTLRRLRLTKVGAGRDTLSLGAFLLDGFAELGLPGVDVTLALSDAGGEYFRATVPGNAIGQNISGTRLRFRDRSGTLADGIIRLVMGVGSGGTRLKIRARGLDLSGADAGPFTATLEFGAQVRRADRTLRTIGTRLVWP